MRMLWLTLADPDPPTNGQFIYSGGLIQSVAAAGASVCVVAMDRPESKHRDGDRTDAITWSLSAHCPRSRWRGLATSTPFLVSRVMTAEMRRRVAAAIDHVAWDAIVIDSIAQGWAFPLIERRGRHAPERPRLVYIAHNHEVTIARMLADDEPRTLHRLVKNIDARRMARLEAMLVRSADLVTSNSPEDRERFERARGAGTVLFLPPRYSGARCEERTITAATPRRAIVVGSFDWPAKRTSLEEFLGVADPLFAAAGIELLVVGRAEAAYLDRLRASVRATRFTGPVDDIDPYFGAARLALVPDRFGGFKLKTLDYVFHRLPIFAISGAAPGLPMRNGEGIFLANDHLGLARLVLCTIDDFALLNRAQETAFLACQDQFDGSAIAARLLLAIAAAGAVDWRRSEASSCSSRGSTACDLSPGR
jgi:polysaccharide biosynthesis protein PslH